MDDGEVQQLLALTSRIYDAALDGSLWEGALESACAYVGGSAANLFSQDVENRRPTVVFQWGNDPHYEKLYLEKYYRMNPLAPAMSAFEVGLVHSQSDVMSYDEFYQTRFYQEWVRPQGVVDVVGANLERTKTRFAMLAIRRHERDGLVTDDTRRRLGLIVPHVRRAISIGQVLDFQSAIAAALTDTLQAIRTGVVLVDAKGRIIFANRAARVVLDAAAVARDANGVFTAADAKAGQLLADAFASAEKGDAAVGVKGVAVPLPGIGGERWVAHVLPLTSGARRETGASHSASAAVFIRKASVSTPSSMESVAKLYRLTPTEIRVLHAMVEIGGVPATADSLGVSETTVKTHLQNLFAKTGVHRQADLVKLVASASTEFVQ